MITVDIPMPKNCDDCPFSYQIRTGKCEGRIMCNAMEARGNALHALVFREPVVMYDPFVPHDDDDYLVDDYLRSKPESCPIKEEISDFYYR